MKWINFKIMGERSKAYIGYIQFVMVGYIFIVQIEFDLITTILLVVLALGAVSLIDFKWIFPAEQNVIAKKNPFLMEMRKDIKAIRQRIDREGE